METITEGNFTVGARPSILLDGKALIDCYDTAGGRHALEREILSLITRNQELREDNLSLRKQLRQERRYATD